MSPRLPAPVRRLAALAALAVVAGCGGGGKSTGSSATSGAQTPADFDFGPNNPKQVAAFGDSITRGVVSDDSITGNNYPNNLQSMLKGLDSGWRVINRGSPGETTQFGVRRFPGAIAGSGYTTIMEGTNDATERDDPAFIVANLQAMVDQARASRTIPVVGTIPPNFRDDPGAQSIIEQANGMIRTMARSQRAVLADVFAGMNDRSLFGNRPNDDPLHPNERGYAVMAGIWFSALQQALPAARRDAAPPPEAPSPPPPPVIVGSKLKRKG